VKDLKSVKAHLDKISPSVCYAKWLHSDINFNQHTTASCHLNLPHKISKVAVGRDIFNTPQKTKERQAMLSGQQPKGCDYCWKLERQGSVSDRLIQSQTYMQEGYDASVFTQDKDVVPSTVAITFDNLCNFACSYCDNSQSTTWGNLLHKQGYFENIHSDETERYKKSLNTYKIDRTQHERLYNELCKYFENNHTKINTVRFLGGEPCTSPTFWKFIKFLSTLNCKHMGMQIFSNCCPSNKFNINVLANYINDFKKIQIYGSVENIEQSAEFTRYGTDWNTILQNITNLNAKGVVISLACTISALTVLNYDKFLEWVATQPYVYSSGAYQVVNPAFQSLRVLPKHIRDNLAHKINHQLEKNKEIFVKLDAYDQIQNVVDTLNNNSPIENIDMLQKDLKTFTKQFAQKTGKDVSVLGSAFETWLKEND
jgi:organic radical activating enzyme